MLRTLANLLRRALRLSDGAFNPVDPDFDDLPAVVEPVVSEPAASEPAAIGNWHWGG